MRNKVLSSANIIFGLSAYCITAIYVYNFIKAYSGLDPGTSFLLSVTISALCIIYFFAQLFNARKYKILIPLYLVLVVLLFLALLQTGGQYMELLNTISPSISAFFASPSLASLFWAGMSISPILHILALASGTFIIIYIRKLSLK